MPRAPHDQLQQRPDLILQLQHGGGHHLAGLVGPGLDLRPRVGVVGQPFSHPESLLGNASELIATVALGDVAGDAGQRADVVAHVAAADLPAAGDQHHPEGRIVTGQAVGDHRRIPRLEHP